MFVEIKLGNAVIVGDEQIRVARPRKSAATAASAQRREAIPIFSETSSNRPPPRL